MNIRSKLKSYYLRYAHLKRNLKMLTLGSATGAFMGVKPILPVRTVAATVPLKANTMATLIIANLFTGLFTLVFVYCFLVFTGNAVTTYTPNWGRVTSVLNVLTFGSGMNAGFGSVGSLGLEALVVLVGGVTLAIPADLKTYAFSFRLVCVSCVVGAGWVVSVAH